MKKYHINIRYAKSPEVIKGAFLSNALDMSNAYIGNPAVVCMVNQYVDKKAIETFGSCFLTTWLVDDICEIERLEWKFLLEGLKSKITSDEVTHGGDVEVGIESKDALSKDTIAKLNRYTYRQKYTRDLLDRVRVWNNSKLTMILKSIDNLNTILDYVTSRNVKTIVKDLSNRLEKLKDSFTRKNDSIFSICKAIDNDTEELRYVLHKVNDHISNRCMTNLEDLVKINSLLSEANFIIDSKIFNKESFILEEMLDLVCLSYGNEGEELTSNDKLFINTIIKLLSKYKGVTSFTRDMRCDIYLHKTSCDVLGKILAGDDESKFMSIKQQLETYWNHCSKEEVKEEDLLSSLELVNSDNLLYIYFNLYEHIIDTRSRLVSIPSFETGYGILTILARILSGYLFVHALKLKKSERTLQSEYKDYVAKYEDLGLNNSPVTYFTM